MLARVKVPVGYGVPRFLQVGDRRHFVPLEDVMANTLDLLFPGLNVTSCELFRVTRNANTERDEDEADDLLELVESELRDRRFAPIVRLEVGSRMDTARRHMLASELGLSDPLDVFEVDGILALRDLMQLAAIDEPALHDPPLHPVEPPRLPPMRNIFHAIRDVGVVPLLHPYESFAGSTERFLREASQDPKVRAIKMTLYRTSSDARIPGYLIDAARNGKQVAVVVELKARFDEAANIGFAGQLEEAGIHVSYGVVGFKTHCKVVLVVREDHDGLRRYVHIGTGNYHPGTARTYTDIGLLTTNPDLSRDVTELFNYLTTGYGPQPRLRKAAGRPGASQAGAAGAHRARDAPRSGGFDPIQDECARGRGHHPRPVSRVAGGCAGRPARARHVSVAAGHPRRCPRPYAWSALSDVFSSTPACTTSAIAARTSTSSARRIA